MSGGDVVSAYVPESGIQELLKEHKDSPVWKLRYTSNGSTLYSVCDGGVLRRYRRYPDRHEYLGEVYRHKGDIQDLDISPYDECILPLFFQITMARIIQSIFIKFSFSLILIII